MYNTYTKNQFRVSVKLNKHYYLITTFKILIYCILTLLASMIVGAFIELVLSSIESTMFKFSFVIITFSLFVIIMAKICENRYNDYMYINNDLSGTVRNNKKCIELKFSLLDLYQNDQVKLIEYTWSHRVRIIIKSLDGYRVCITGDKEVNHILVPMLKKAGLKVKEIDDEPSD